MMLFVICYIVIYVDDTTLYCKCDQVYDLWQQLELPSELESDLQNTVHCDRKWMLENTNLFRLIVLINLVVLMWKLIGLFLKTNYLLRYCDCLWFLNWNGTLKLSLLLNLPPRKWSLNLLYEIFFSWVCSLSLNIYHADLLGIMLAYLGCYS